MIPLEQRKGLRTWIEVDASAIGKNFKTFRTIIPPTSKIMAVVKSNAYGHSLVDFSKEIIHCGADALAVDSIVEALSLRREGITKPILVLGYTLPEMLAEAVKNDISITVSSLDHLNTAKKELLPQKLKIHIKVDTGMHRQGFLKEEIENVSEFLLKNKSLFEVEGLYTHFASAKNPDSTGFTKTQLEIFELWTSAFKKAGISCSVHSSATSGALLFPESHFDMVRIGAGLYGLWPSAEIEDAFQSKIALQSVLSWKTIISEIKHLETGESIGYDLTHTLKRDSKIAICPIGYWHGYPRSLSNKGYVLVKGVQTNILGRISMDMIVIDITDVPSVGIGEEVVLLGKSGEKVISPADLALLADTSSYEIVTRLNPLIKRIYI